jgi:hypothetical protein
MSAKTRLTRALRNLDGFDEEVDAAYRAAEDGDCARVERHLDKASSEAPEGVSRMEPGGKRLSALRIQLQKQCKVARQDATGALAGPNRPNSTERAAMARNITQRLYQEGPRRFCVKIKARDIGDLNKVCAGTRKAALRIATREVRYWVRTLKFAELGRVRGGADETRRKKRAEIEEETNEPIHGPWWAYLLIYGGAALVGLKVLQRRGALQGLGH